MKALKTQALIVSILAISLLSKAQQNVTVDLNTKYQTIQGFGASDAWNADAVGKYWSTSTKEQIAKWLFSTEIVGNNPSGIGLSRWRFNIGAGSAEQGSSSNISQEERRAECFITKVETVDGKEVVTYDWTKQQGQQWFLNAAKQYNVNQLVAFINSPPVFYTKNGRANSDNTNRFGNTNLGSSNYNRYTDFMTTVLKHFSDQGTPFAQISPINEPQYEWASGQEGCPWKHSEVYTLVDKLNRDLLAKGLTTKILLSEAADYKNLTGNKDDPDKSDIIDNYFTPSSPYFMGNFSQVLNGIGAHAYWVNGTDASIASTRATVKSKLASYPALDVYQTEYNLLNEFFGDKTTNAVYLAKIIYADLELAGVSIWDYWTAMERERWSQQNRFFLIKLTPSGGSYASLTNAGTAAADKNLWALGNFSRFVRPGYKRVKTTGASDLAGLMGVSFVAPDNSELITVYVNWSDNAISVKENLSNLPSGLYADNAEVYTTDASNNLTKGSSHTLSNSYSIPSKSIVTFRVPLKQIPCFVQPTATISTTAPTCGSNNGTIKFEFNTVSGQSSYDFSINGGTTYVDQIPSTQRSYTFNNLAAGSYSLFVRWGDNQCPVDLGSTTLVEPTCNFDCNNVNNGTAFLDVCNICVGSNTGKTACQIPYTTRLPIPGTIEAEFFDKGGEMISYHDATIANQGNQLRLTEAVDIQLNNGSYFIGWTAADEWMEYSINVAETGMYACVFTAASINANGAIQLEIDNVPMGAVTPIPNTGGWYNWTSVNIGDLSLTEGNHILKLVSDQGGYNLDKMIFSKVVISGVENATDEIVEVFPNPFTNDFSVQTSYQGEVKIEVFNALGQLISTETTNGSSTEIDLSNSSNGLYFIKITTGNQVITREILKK